jgi:hypothetical protein
MDYGSLNFLPEYCAFPRSNLDLNIYSILLIEEVNMKTLLTVFISLVLVNPNSISKVWEVPGDCPTIQVTCPI